MFEITRKNNIKFYLNKCKFGQKQISYLGHIISSEGIRPQIKKINVIKNMPKPQCKQDVQRLLGMLTYVSKFIKKFSDNTKPCVSF